jgi:hypothetical protein
MERFVSTRVPHVRRSSIATDVGMLSSSAHSSFRGPICLSFPKGICFPNPPVRRTPWNS